MNGSFLLLHAGSNHGRPNGSYSSFSSADRLGLRFRGSAAHWFAACLAYLSAWLVCGSIQAADLPAQVIPEGVGVNIHFVTGHERDLDMIRAAGFKFIRMDFGWAAIERRKGVYDWSDYDKLLTNLEARGLRPVFILDYANGLYENTVTNEDPITHRPRRVVAAPQHPDSIAAFARWATASARHYHGHRILWEIWNEPNIQFWTPKPDAAQYAALALAAARAVREAEPAATVIAPASSTFPWEFLETLFKSGVLEYLDAVSVHPYRNPHRAPETAAADYRKLRELIDRYAPASRRGHIPILSGEWGYSSNTKGVTLETQAMFAARQQLSNLLNGVPLSIWYDWKNDGTNPAENEENFGTVTANLDPKPAYLAIRTLTTELAGYRIERRLALPNDQEYVLVLTNADGQAKLAAWTLGESHEVKLRLKGQVTGAVPLVKYQGERSSGTATNTDELTLELTGGPQYVTLGHARVE